MPWGVIRTRLKGRKLLIACECKYWQSRVPQNVIHSFRTVLADIGANVGYIVSMVGFQSGAFKASELTNIELLTWKQFQKAFEDTWYDEYLIKQVVTRLDPLFTYTEPLPSVSWFNKLTEEDKNRYITLYKKYEVFGWLMMHFTPYVKKRLTLPISNTKFKGKIPENIASATGYREFLELANVYGNDAIAQFRELRDKVK